MSKNIKEKIVEVLTEKIEASYRDISITSDAILALIADELPKEEHKEEYLNNFDRGVETGRNNLLSEIGKLIKG